MGDTITSGSGNDTIAGDYLYFGTGNPIVNSYNPLYISVFTSDSDNGGNDIIKAGAGDDIIIGGQV